MKPEIEDTEKKIWFCKIGEVDRAKLPRPGDPPMRDAVTRAYIELTGEEPNFLFSGWGAELTRGERAVVDNTIPEPEPQDEELESVKAERDSYLALLNGEDPEGNEDSYPVLMRLKEAEEKTDTLLSALEAAQRERDQANEAVQTLSEGKPLGPLVGSHTIVNQALEIKRLTKELEAAQEENKGLREEYKEFADGIAAQTLAQDERETALEEKLEASRQEAAWSMEALNIAAKDMCKGRATFDESEYKSFVTGWMVRANQALARTEKEAKNEPPSPGWFLEGE